MKKLIYAVCAAALCISLTGCGKSGFKTQQEVMEKWAEARAETDFNKMRECVPDAAFEAVMEEYKLSEKRLLVEMEKQLMLSGMPDGDLKSYEIKSATENRKALLSGYDARRLEKLNCGDATSYYEIEGAATFKDGTAYNDNYQTLIQMDDRWYSMNAIEDCEMAAMIAND